LALAVLIVLFGAAAGYEELIIVVKNGFMDFGAYVPAAHRLKLEMIVPLAALTYSEKLF